MTELSAFGLLTAFVGGTASFLSPCVLPLVPGYLSYIAGGSCNPSTPDTHDRWRALGLSACFVLGFSIVFLIFGASITVIGQLFLAYRYEMNIAAGIIIALAGLLVMGVVRTPVWFHRYYRFEPSMVGGSPTSATILGMAFGFGWTPCIGPILGGILALGATADNVATGTLLLGVYAIGLGIPFLLTAFFTGHFMRRAKALRRAGRYLQWVTGMTMVIMGIAVSSGQLMQFATWLLKTFPVLGGVG